MTGGTRPTGARVTSRRGLPPGPVVTVAEVACGPCQMRGQALFVAQLEREGTRLDLNSFTVKAAKEKERLERALEYARTVAKDAGKVAEAEARIESHKAKLREQIGGYSYTFDVRTARVDVTYNVRCPSHGLLVVSGAAIAEAVQRHKPGHPVYIRAERSHSA